MAPLDGSAQQQVIESTAETKRTVLVRTFDDPLWKSGHNLDRSLFPSIGISIIGEPFLLIVLARHRLLDCFEL